MQRPTVTWLVGTLLASSTLAMLLGELRLPELSIMYSASLSSTVESVRIAVYPSHNPLLLGFETRLFLKFRNREGNAHKDASRSESQ